ncbi:MAG: SAM-dependent chlorinase/fluorinase [Candidatus Lernaella stagnicola]|nr:SAM-dependent chlorinase/fluorinase [Candidatus Lernaella stagnicola]
MILTLTTDFGLADGYAGAMKGVILSRAPRANVVDISHEVPPHDVLHGAFVLFQAAPFFPPDTVHVAVIDPGVGTARRGIVVAHRRHFFVGPDNGVFSPFLDEQAVVYELADPDLWLPDPSATFHGRDLFAPAAAQLATGLPPAECGPRVDDPVRLPAWRLKREGDSFVTAVVHIDRFGNCITALPGARLAELGSGTIRVIPEGGPALALRRAYGEVEVGEPLALVGSSGLLEIAVRNGHAARVLELTRETVVRISVS